MRKFITALLIALSARFSAGGVRVTTYASKYAGRRTSTGTIYNPHEFTAAANRDSLIGRTVTIYNEGRSVTVRVTDRFAREKFRLRTLRFDLTPRAMRALGLRGAAFVDSVSATNDPVTTVH